MIHYSQDFSVSPSLLIRIVVISNLSRSTAFLSAPLHHDVEIFEHLLTGLKTPVPVRDNQARLVASFRNHLHRQVVGAVVRLCYPNRALLQAWYFTAAVIQAEYNAPHL